MPFDVLLREEIEKHGRVPPALRAIFMFEKVSEPFRLGDLQVNGIPLTARNAMPWRFQMRVRDGGGDSRDVPNLMRVSMILLLFVG